MSDDLDTVSSLRVPTADRHVIARVRQTSLTRARNTVIEPWVSVSDDLALIRAGDALRVGDRVFVNGRTYGIESSGTLYPIAGPGFIQLDRVAFKALGVYSASIMSSVNRPKPKQSCSVCTTRRRSRGTRRASHIGREEDTTDELPRSVH